MPSDPLRRNPPADAVQPAGGAEGAVVQRARSERLPALCHHRHLAVGLRIPPTRDPIPSDPLRRNPPADAVQPAGDAEGAVVQRTRSERLLRIPPTRTPIPPKPLRHDPPADAIQPAGEATEGVVQRARSERLPTPCAQAPTNRSERSAVSANLPFTQQALTTAGRPPPWPLRQACHHRRHRQATIWWIGSAPSTPTSFWSRPAWK